MKTSLTEITKKEIQKVADHLQITQRMIEQRTLLLQDDIQYANKLITKLNGLIEAL